jgi:hypothetical protein
MKYSLIINENDNRIIPQIELLESLGHSVEVIEVDPESTVVVNTGKSPDVIGEPIKYVSWKNYNALNFFIQ